MSTGAALLITMTLVLIWSILVAVYFRRLADRLESGETVPSAGTLGPAKLRKMGDMLIWGMLPFWLFIALISFGVIPTGIDTIQF